MLLATLGNQAARRIPKVEREGVLWEAVVVEGYEGARDSVSGALIKVRSGPDYMLYARVDLPAKSPFEISMYIEKKYPDAQGIGAHNPMIKLLVGDFNSVVKESTASYAEKTEFIRYLLEGMASINRKWPLCHSPYFYSDLDRYGDRASHLFAFNFPTDEDLARL